MDQVWFPWRHGFVRLRLHMSQSLWKVADIQIKISQAVNPELWLLKSLLALVPCLIRAGNSQAEAPLCKLGSFRFLWIGRVCFPRNWEINHDRAGKGHPDFRPGRDEGRKVLDNELQPLVLWRNYLTASTLPDTVFIYLLVCGLCDPLQQRLHEGREFALFFQGSGTQDVSLTHSKHIYLLNNWLNESWNDWMNTNMLEKPIFSSFSNLVP